MCASWATLHACVFSFGTPPCSKPLVLSYSLNPSKLPFARSSFQAARSEDPIATVREAMQERPATAPCERLHACCHMLQTLSEPDERCRLSPLHACYRMHACVISTPSSTTASPKPQCCWISQSLRTLLHACWSVWSALCSRTIEACMSMPGCRWRQSHASHCRMAC
jgi:hypothetical protein